jgi:hypothetical protein
MRTNFNYGEMTTCEPTDTKAETETAKEILENMDVILKELFAELRRIDDAIYSPRTVGENANEPKQECFLGTLDRQRNVAQALLDLAIHIREGLW